MSTTEITSALDGADGRRSRLPSYVNIRSRVFGSAWAIRKETFLVIVDLLDHRAAGVRLTASEVQDRVEEGQALAAANRRGSAGQPGVAVIPLYGVLAPHASSLDGVSSPSGISVDEFRRAFRAALADEQVGSILIEIDSPGGTVDLIPELAAEIRGARGRKPIVALANTMAASGAYWLMCQADEAVVTPSGQVGSVGVYAAHEDVSEQMAQDGVKVTLVSAGAYKTEGNPYEPLSEDARAHVQEMVDGFYSMFVTDVAKGRGLPVAQVREGFGQGRMVTAQDAVKAGMADRVGTFDQTVARMARGQVSSRARAEVSQTGFAARASVTVTEARGDLDATWFGATAVPSHSTKVIDEPWDGPAEEAKLAEPITKARGTGMYAWYDQNGDDPDGDGYPDAKADWKFPHHMVTDGEPGPANAAACRNGLARLTDAHIPDEDRAGVKAHLQKHLDDFDAANESTEPADDEQQESSARAQEREPAEPELVNAERLLGRKAVRDTFGPAATVNTGGQ